MSMNNVQDTTSKAIEEAASTSHQAADKTLRAASETLEHMHERVNAARTRAGETIDQLSERAQHYARVGMDKAAETRDRAKRGLQNAGDATSHYVADQPLKSIAIAAGVGAATAALLMMLRGRDR